MNQEEFGGPIPQSDWIKMITVNPAAALALESKIGRLAPGLKADITVVRGRNDDPSASLLLNHPPLAGWLRLARAARHTSALRLFYGLRGSAIEVPYIE